MSMESTQEVREASPLSWLQLAVVGLLYWPPLVLLAMGSILLELSGHGESSFLGWLVFFLLYCCTAVWLWMKLLRGKFRAGFASGIMACVYSLFFLVGFSLVGHGCGAGEDEPDHGATQASGLLEGDNRSVETFAECIEALHQRQRGSSSMRQEALYELQKEKRWSPDLVENAVQDVMIAVCEKVDEGRVRELRPYFFKAVKYQQHKIWRVESRWDYCELEEFRPSAGQWREDEAREQVRLMQAAMCRIDDRYAQAIRQKAMGDSHGEIASQMGISEAQSRQFVSRGRRALAAEMAKLERY